MAEEVGSLRVGLSLNSAKFEQSMASVDRNLKALGQEMGIVRNKGKDWGTSTEGLTTKQQALTRMLESQDVKVKKLNEAYQKAVTEQGENSKAAENLAIKLNKATAEMTKTETELEQVTSALSKQQTELMQAENKWNKLGDSMREVGTKMKAVGDKMLGVGKNLSAAVTLPILGIGAASVKTAMDFEAGMDRVGAIAGATEIELKALSDTALELGASTSKSASEVAEGMENMAAMGFNANEIMAAMPGIISAAEASGSDMALTADVVAAALNGFALEASEATRVADILSQTANQSAADITDMQYALKYAAPIANSLGVSLEELSASIGIMSDAGIEGSQAGTTLRGGLIALLKPAEKTSKMMEAMGISVEDANGKFIGLGPLIQNISESLEGQTEVQKLATLAQLVGTEAASGFLVLMEAGPKKIDKMTKALENSGGASAETAAKMKDNLKGALEELGGTLETAAITIGTILTPAIQRLGEIVQGIVEKFQGFSPEGQKMALIFAAIAAAIGPLLIAFGFIASAVGSLLGLFGTISAAIGVVTTGIAAATPAVGALATVFTLLTGPVGIAIAAIAGVIAVMVLAYNKIDWFRTGVNAIWDTIKEYTMVAFEAIKNTISTIVSNIVLFVGVQLAVFKSFWDENGKQIVSIIRVAFGQIKSNIELVMGIIKGVFQISWPLITATVRYAWETIKLVVSTAINLVLGIVQTVLKVLQGDWKGAWNAILNTVKTIWASVGKFLNGIDLAGTGRNIMQGLLNGIASMADAIWKKVSSIVDGIKSAITGALKIKSPSRVTMEYGVNVGQGLVNGIQKMNSAVKNSATQMANSANPQGGNTLSEKVSPSASVSASAQPIIMQTFLNGRMVAEAIHGDMSKLMARQFSTAGRSEFG